MLSNHRPLAALLALALFPALAQAQNCRIDRFSSSTSSPDNLFGDDIDISGDRMLIGAPFEDLVDAAGVTFPDDGAAHAYRKVAGEWVQDGVLFPGSPQPSVSQHARTVAIDADRAAAAGQGATLVFTYDRQPTGWVARPPLQVTDFTGLAEVRDLDLQGDRLFVGLRLLPTQDQVFVDEYQDVAGAWTLVQRVFIGASGLAVSQSSFDSPGEIEIVGEQMFVGVPGDSAGGKTGAGSVRVLERVSGFWTETAVLTAGVAIDNGSFGASLDAEQDRVLVGHRSVPGGAGLATLFEKLDGVWVRVVELPGPGTQGLGFGELDVALQGDAIAVGDPDGLPGFVPATRGIVGLHRLEAGTWTQAGKLRAIGDGNDERFGDRITFGPDGELLVAHPEQNSALTVRGIVDAFALDGSGCSDFLLSPKVESVTGGVVTEMALLGGGAQQGLGYAVLASTTPGGSTTIDGVDIPIQADAFTSAALSGGSAFVSLVGILGPQGFSEAPSLRIASLPAATVGLELQLAWVSFGFAAEPFGVQFASELRTIRIEP